MWKRHQRQRWIHRLYASQRTSTLHPKPQWSYYRILRHYRPVHDNGQLIFLLKMKLYTHVLYTRHHKHIPTVQGDQGSVYFQCQLIQHFPLCKWNCLYLYSMASMINNNLNAIQHYAPSTIQKKYNLHICRHVLLKTAPK